MDEEWKGLRENLRDYLEHEIRLMRELLSNMHQEEISLMLSDLKFLDGLLQVRSEMVEKLSFLRQQRQEVMEKMTRGTDSLEEVLPTTDEISAEILCLSDQLMTLAARMNRQQTQNQRLEHGCDRHFLPQMEQQRPQKKAAVATLHLKK